MNRDDRTEAGLDADGRRFVDRLVAAYRPPDRTPAQNTAFDAKLRERVESAGSGVPFWAFGTVMAAAAVATLLIVGRSGGPGMPAEEIASNASEAVEVGEAVAGVTAEDALMALAFENDEADGAVPDLGDALPDDYAAIDSLFLGG